MTLGISKKDNIRSELFLKYDYPETKEMCKQFLTLICSILVLSLTFSEKIVGFKTADITSRWLVIIAWALFLLAIISCGIGLLLITMAAGKAVYNQGNDSYYLRVATQSYRSIILAGIAFVIGLGLLIGTSISAIYQSEKSAITYKPQVTFLIPDKILSLKDDPFTPCFR